MNWLSDEKRPPGGTCKAAVGEAKVSEHRIVSITVPPPAQDDYSSFRLLLLPELGQFLVGHSGLG
jgi:hypothetical protein